MSAPDRLDLAVHAWLRAPASLAVMEALSPGESDQARYVGGCVRNALLGEPVDDIDIATTHRPEDAASALDGAGIKVVPTGLAHGTLTAVCKGQPFEITTLRKDVHTDGRHAVVAFTTDWREDAQRRDFRLNAIYADRRGALFDPCGGAEDIAERRIAFIGKAEDRIAEDVLRILRFYRFTAWYGRAVGPAGHAACSALAGGIARLSVERVWKEFKKLLSAPNPALAVKAMHEGHVLKQVLPGRIDFNLLLSIIAADRGKSRAPDSLLRLAALLGRDGVAMQGVVEHMKASNAEKARSKAMLVSCKSLGLESLHPNLPPKARDFALYKMGAQAFADQIRLAEAAGEGEADRALEAAEMWRKPRFPLNGKDLIAAGMERGPQLGERLEALESEWARNGFEMDREALLARLQGSVS